MFKMVMIKAKFYIARGILNDLWIVIQCNSY